MAIYMWFIFFFSFAFYKAGIWKPYIKNNKLLDNLFISLYFVSA